MLVKIYEDSPNYRDVRRVVHVLENGGVVIYPTDTIYAIGCSINSKKGIERVARIKGIDIQKANFSIICSDLSNLSDYTKPLNNAVFKMLKSYLPGPYTFILRASGNVPKLLMSKKKTIGIRVPANNIIRSIVEELGCPIITTSVHDDDEVLEYTTDPELILEKYENVVDALVDGGYGGNVPSTIIDCSTGEPEILREGLGAI